MTDLGLWDATTRRRWQTRIFFVSWLTYAGFYLGRVNLAVAMPALGASFGWNRATLGLLGSAFYWVYALSQLVNGHLGERVSARKFVMLGLVVSAALNALFGSLHGFGPLLLVWAANGWAQATGWGPIMRTLSRWFSPAQRGRLTAYFSPCYVAGNAVAWAFAGWMIAVGGWRWAFLGPAVLLLMVAAGWFLGVRDGPAEMGGQAEAGPAASDGRASESIWQGLRALFAHPNMRPALAVCLLSGMIKDGLTLWGPTYLMEQGRLSVSVAALVAVIIPLAGACGAFVAGWFLHHRTRGREMPIVALLAGVVALAVIGQRILGLVALDGWLSPALGLALVAAMALGSHGTNALLLASVPLSLGPRGRVSSAAGTLDFISYVGGGASALLVGGLQDLAGWSAVYLWWGVVAVAIVVLALFRARREQVAATPEPTTAAS